MSERRVDLLLVDSFHTVSTVKVTILDALVIQSVASAMHLSTRTKSIIHKKRMFAKTYERNEPERIFTSIRRFSLVQKGEADDSGNEDTDDGFGSAAGSTRQPKRSLPNLTTTMASGNAGNTTIDSLGQSSNAATSSATNNRRNELLNELLLELTMVTIPWTNQTSYLSQLPPEVMLAIMKCMDDLSIYALAKASHRWRLLINSTVDWKHFIRTRWPLFPLSDEDHSINLSRIYDQL